MSKRKLFCYASQLGGCSAIQTKEHALSQGLFPGKHISTEGPEWLGGQRRTLAKSSLGKPILCSVHNGALSPLDGLAVQFRKTVEEYFVQLRIRRESDQSEWFPDNFNLSGHDLERWAAKYAVGHLFEHKDGRWHDTDSPAAAPPIDILHSIFHDRPFESPLGLYVISDVGESLNVKYTVGIEGLYHPSTIRLVGSVINFMNIHFLIWLSKEDPSSLRIEMPSGLIFGTGPEDRRLKYRVARFQFNANGRTSGLIEFSWHDRHRNDTLYFG